MNKQNYLLLLFFIFLSTAHAQKFEWSKVFSGTNYLGIDQQIETFENNVYVVGEFRSSISFGTTTLTTANSSNSIYIANFDTLGNFRWAIKGGNNNKQDELRGCKLDKFGNLYLLGEYVTASQWGALSLNVSGTNPQSSEFFLVKINNQGMPQWLNAIYSPTSSGVINTSIEDVENLSIADSTIYFVKSDVTSLAYTGSNVIFSNPLGAQLKSSIVGRVGLDGTLKSISRIVEKTSVNSFGEVRLKAIEAIDNHSFILTGAFKGGMLFGSNNLGYDFSGLGIGGGVNLGIGFAKFTDTICNWVNGNEPTFNPSFANNIKLKITLCKNKDLVAVSLFRDSLTIQNQTITSISGAGSYWATMRFDSNGVLKKIKNLGVVSDFIGDVVETAQGDLAYIGTFTDSVTLNGVKIYSSFGSGDILILDTDTLLEPKWHQTGGGSVIDYGLSLASEGTASIYALGLFRGLSQFGTTYYPGSNSLNTNIIMKLSECGVIPVSLTFNGDTNLCAGQSVRVLANSSLTSTYQWLKSGVPIIGEIYRDILINSSGNYQVIVNGSGCVDTSRMIAVHVGTLPMVTLNVIDTVCQYSNPFLLTGGLPLGGTYSGLDVTNNIFDPTYARVGNYKITYSYSNGGCVDSTFDYIYIKPAPTVYFAPIQNVCINSLPVTFTNAFPSGGIFTGTGVNGTQFDPAVAGGGIHPITYSYLGVNGCSASTTSVIKVDTFQTAMLAALPTFCAQDGPYTLSEGAPKNGRYEGAGVSNGIFDPSVSGPGSFTIRYILSNGCGSDTALQTITVNPAPTVSLGSYASICEGSSPMTLSGGTPLGGVYSGVAVSGGQFNPSTSGVGTFTIYYDYTDGIGCSSQDSSTITVNPLPSISMGNDTSICVGSSIILNVSGGNSYVWSNAATTASVTVSPISTTKYYVTVNNASNCQEMDSVTVTVNPNPIAAITGASTICEGESTLLTATGGVGYLWSDASTTAINSVNPTVSTMYTVTVTNINGCSDVTSQFITVNPAPIVSLGSYSSICASSSPITLSGGTPLGGFYSGVGVNGGQFDPLTSGVGTFTIYYDYTDGIGCSSQDSSTITVNQLPSISMSNDTSICLGSSIVLNVSGGSSFLWSNVATTASVTVSPMLTTTYYVTVNNASNCQEMDSVTVVVNPNPIAAITGASTICEGESTILTATGGVGYLWSDASTTAINSVNPAVSTTYTVTVTNTNGCSDVTSQFITVNPSPTVILGAFSSICEGSSPMTLSGGTPLGGVYSGVGVSGGQFDPLTIGVGSFTIYYDYTDGLGCSSQDSSTITVNPLPIISMSNDTSICIGDSISLNAISTTSNYLWSTNQTSSRITVSPLNSTYYTITSFNGASCFVKDSIYVTVNNPTPTFIGTDVLLDPTTIPSKTYDAGMGYTSYLWNNSSTNQTITVSYDPLKAGKKDTISVIATNVFGCPSKDSGIVTYDINTGITTERIGASIIIYPNPVVDELIIVFGEAFKSNRTIEIFDLTGKRVFQKNTVAGNSREQLSLGNEQLKGGLYTIRVISDEGVFVKKFILK
jgi:predicted transcriptional regulator